jgi:peptidoglycan hydrolase-like protein with peptidoglycan-binding domain/GH25 family lysozyme M1 (1,4-beta-N-acetylmuramidase)
MALPMMGGASIDEHGRARGGHAGDQTGREVKRQRWYLHGQGSWVVLRAEDPAVAEIIAATMEDIVDNDLIGYDQGQRQTLFEKAEPLNFDPAAIGVKCECDCSSAVHLCLWRAGIMVGDVDHIFRTGTMIPAIVKTGKFAKLTARKYSKTSVNLKRGDILVTPDPGHTVVMLSDGSAVARKLGGRPLTRGASGQDVEDLQVALKTLGYGRYLGRFGENKDGVDGDYGTSTMNAVKAFEKAVGLPVCGPIDGVADLKTIAAIIKALTAGEVAPPEEPDQPDDDVEDDTPEPGDGTTQPDEIPDYKCNWVVATQGVNVRTGPGTQHPSKITLFTGTGLMYDGETRDGFHAVLFRGKRAWVSSKFSRFEVREKFIVDLSTYDDVDDWATFAKYVSYVWIRVACRRKTERGEVYQDAKFREFAAACVKYGIPFGVYVYGRADTAARGREEAQKAVAWAEPYGPTTYVYDIEAGTLTFASCAAFLAEVERLTGKPVGIYVGRHWSQVDAGKLKRSFTWRPYYRSGNNGGGTHGDREPTPPDDFHQFTCSLIVPGKKDPGDGSHVNTDPKTNGFGRTIEWLRTGGKAA